MVSAIKAGTNLELGTPHYWNQALAVKNGDLTEVTAFLHSSLDIIWKGLKIFILDFVSEDFFGVFRLRFART